MTDFLWLGIVECALLKWRGPLRLVSCTESYKTCCFWVVLFYSQFNFNLISWLQLISFTRTQKKIWILACPLDKHLSGFACPGQVLVDFLNLVGSQLAWALAYQTSYSEKSLAWQEYLLVLNEQTALSSHVNVHWHYQADQTHACRK